MARWTLLITRHFGVANFVQVPQSYNANVKRHMMYLGTVKLSTSAKHGSTLLPGMRFALVLQKTAISVTEESWYGAVMENAIVSAMD